MKRRRYARPISSTLLVVSAALVCCSIGCDKERSWRQPGPEEQFREFLTRWYNDGGEAAFEMIDPEDRRELGRPTEELSDRFPEIELPKQSEMLVAGRVDNRYDVKSIEVEPQLESKPASGDRFRLKLTYEDGRTGAATMVWRDDRWYVDLPLGTAASKGADAAAFGEPGGAPEKRLDEVTDDLGVETPGDAGDVDSGTKRRD